MTQPTETPPAEGSTSMARTEHSNDSNSGPVSGNRTPMVVTFVALGFLLVCVVGVLAYALWALVR
jgi:hypothetical protein